MFSAACTQIPPCTHAGSDADRALISAQLSAVAEYVAFCHKLKILPSLLEDIEVNLLNSLERQAAGGCKGHQQGYGFVKA